MVNPRHQERQPTPIHHANLNFKGLCHKNSPPAVKWLLGAFIASSIAIGASETSPQQIWQGAKDFCNKITQTCKTHTGGTNDLPRLNP